MTLTPPPQCGPVPADPWGLLSSQWSAWLATGGRNLYSAYSVVPQACLKRQDMTQGDLSMLIVKMRIGVHIFG